MPSILDQLDHYYAMKRNAANSNPVSAPSSLRHPKAEEFFDNLMQRQKNDTANINNDSHREKHLKNGRFQSGLVSA